MIRAQVLTWLADNVPAFRLQHSLGVEQTAVELAQHYQLDVEKAAQAGLMHDLAKYFKPSLLLQIAKDEGIEVDSVFEANPHLLHADISAVVARDRFKMQDTEVLDAIANHTLGSPGMSPLSCVVFLADSLEPTRGHTVELDALRQACRQDLYKAVWLTCNYSLKFLVDSPCLIHPRTILTRNWAMAMSNPKNQQASHSKDTVTVIN